MIEIVILAAGKGTRMRSKQPKVLHTLAGKSFLQRVIDTSSNLNPANIVIVVGHGAEQVKTKVAGHNLSFVEQTEQLGTGHAVLQALPQLSEDTPVIILYGDVPLISEGILTELVSLVNANTMGLLSFDMVEPTGYGRVIRNHTGAVQAIVEQKDASEAQQTITEINTGVMAVLGKHLHQWLPTLSNSNAQQEYYLTDIIAMAVADGVTVKTVVADNEIEITGVNSRLQQAELERAFQESQAKTLLAQGLYLADPKRFDLRGQLHHGDDCKIDINCIFEGESHLGNNVTIGANCVLIDAKIGDNVDIKPNSVIEGSDVGKACVIGPFARLRPGTKLENEAKIGNFVETKKAHIGLGSKVNHLSYIGDAELGAGVNIGAGTITCNYDGVNKHKTTIKDGVFVGSNTALVAPVTLGEHSTVGAGSTITKGASEGQLVLTRPRQQNLDGWVRPKATED